MTRAITALVLGAALVAVLPVAIPLMGILALCGGVRRDKPAVRPRPRPRRRAADRTAFGDVLLVTRQGRRLYVVTRTRRRGGVYGLTLSIN